MTDTIIHMDATRIAELVAKRELSPVEVVQAHLDRIAEVNPKVNAIVALADQLAVARSNLAAAEQTLAVVRGRFAAGTASALDVANQEALAAGERALIPNFISQMEQQVIALGILVGEPPERITVRPGTLTALNLPLVAVGLPSELLARRPDVAAAEAQLISQNFNIKVARAAFFPDGKTIAAVGEDERLYCWDVASGRRRPDFVAGAKVRSLAVHPGGALLAVSDATRDVALIDAREGASASWLLNRFIRLLRRYGRRLYPADSQAAYKMKWGTDYMEREYVAARGLSFGTFWNLLLLTRSI